MLMVTICREMGWTYYEYISQPTWFIDLIQDKLVLDNEALIKSTKKRG